MLWNFFVLVVSIEIWYFEFDNVFMNMHLKWNVTLGSTFYKIDDEKSDFEGSGGSKVSDEDLTKGIQVRVSTIVEFLLRNLKASIFTKIFEVLH